jgi:O-6-methylguanine DNA methyltransferase
MKNLFWDTMETERGTLWLCVDHREQVYTVRFGRGTHTESGFQWTAANGRCDFLKKQLYEYFIKQRTGFDLEYVLNGTDFQRQVWQALLTVPYGQIISYSKLAEVIGNPYSYRAVGNAAGANPIAIIVPCHRIIRSSGALGGYAGGVETKRYLLRLEGSYSDDNVSF